MSDPSTEGVPPGSFPSFPQAAHDAATARQVVDNPAPGMDTAPGPDARPRGPHFHTTTWPILSGYEILGELGGGGMGVVYRARELRLNRLVAVKMLRPGEHRDAEEGARFQIEAEAVARLQHPNIVQIFQFGEQDGRPYFAMELVEGQTLAQYASGQPLPNREASQLVERLARAMQHAHERGVIHRDLKPSNILLPGLKQTPPALSSSGSLSQDRPSPLDSPKIADFGLAKHLHRPSEVTLQSGAVLGTPSYMAPEQASGMASEAGPLCDVYGLGAILYECLTGKPPFKCGTNVETLRQVQEEDPLPPSRIRPRLHRDLETICLKCLAKRPARRYASALALAEDLRRFLDGEPILGRREGLTGRLCRRARRNLMATVLVFVVLATTLAAGVFGTRAHREHVRSQLSERLDQELDRCDCLADSVREVEALADELAQQGLPGRASQVRDRLRQKCAVAVREGLRTPRLQREDVDRLRSIVVVLAQRDPEEADRLRQALADRLRDWDVLFDLQVPFNELSEVFDANQVSSGVSLKPRTPGAKDAILRTRVLCMGNVQLEAEFPAGGWEGVPTLGLLLNADREKPGRKESPKPASIAFLLEAPQPGNTSRSANTPVSLGAARSAGSDLKVRIVRNGVVLREGWVTLEPGPLLLRARRQDERLVFQVNRQPGLEFHDPFPLRLSGEGVFGIHLPAGASLVRLRATRQVLPPRPSPLEQGDEAFGRGQFAQAFDHYRAQVRSAPSAADRQEARFKEALCLVRLRRPEEAALLFQRLAGDGVAQRWRLPALCRLWLLEVQRARNEEADAILRTLATDYQFEQMAAFVPAEVREEMLRAYLPRGTFDLLRHNPDRLRNLERALHVQGVLRASPARQARTSYRLLEACQMEGQEARALRLAEELLAGSGLSPSCRIDVTEEYVWLLLRQGQPRRALDEVNRLLARDEKTPLASQGAGSTGKPGREAYLPLLLARARVLAHLKRWQEANKDLELLTGKPSRLAPHPGEKSAQLEAWLVRGFLCEGQGNEKEAQAAWRTGLQLARQQKALHVLSAAIMASLTGELTRQDAEQMVAGVLGGTADRSPVLMLFRMKLFPLDDLAQALRATWRSPRGREYARRIAFRDVSHREMLSVQVVLGVFEGCRAGAFGPGVLSTEHDALLWELFNDLSRAQFSGEVSHPQVVKILTAWAGSTGEFGWAGLAPGLKPSLRGPLAYVMAHRHLRLKRPEDAADYFRAARNDASSGSVLWRLATAELYRLGKRN